MVKEVPLSMGLVALVDDEDYEWVMQYRWYACDHGHTFYAKHSINHHQKICLHRFIMDAKPDEQIDHRSCDGLDCQKFNLRKSTQSQNLMNTRKRKNCTSQYKGVCWCKQTKSWSAKIQVGGKRVHLGRFHNENDAGRAYNNAAKKHYGEFARLNIIGVNKNE